MVTESNMHRDMIAQRPYAYLMYFFKLFGSKLKKKWKEKKNNQNPPKQRGIPGKKAGGYVIAAASGESNKTTLIQFLSLSSLFKLGFPSELY